MSNETRKYPFKIEHLHNVCKIDEPGTFEIKNMTTLDYYDITIKGELARWIIMLKAMTSANIEVVKLLYKEFGSTLTYEDVGHYFFTGVIWENQIKNSINLPVKGENVIATFDYVDDVLRCTGITVKDRRAPKLYDYYTEEYQERLNFENIIKNMKDD